MRDRACPHLSSSAQIVAGYLSAALVLLSRHADPNSGLAPRSSCCSWDRDPSVLGGVLEGTAGNNARRVGRCLV